MNKHYFHNTLSFTERVLSIVRDIPEGSVMSYQEVAERAGNKHACRAVGTIMKKNHRHDIPCHRVVLSSMKCGDYNRGGIVKKRLLLKKEGITISDNSIINYNKYV